MQLSRRQFSLFCYSTIGMVLSCLISPSSADESTPADEIFDSGVAEILIKRCIRCHNPAQKSGGLDLTTAQGIFNGGDSGKVIDPDSPAASRLIALVEHREKPRMPLDQPKLPDSAIATLTKWIAQGATYTKTLVAPTAAEERIRVDRSFWSFRRLQPVVLPKNSLGYSDNPIDAFISHQWELAGLEPPQTASLETLIRRIYLDMHGVPPQPSVVHELASSQSPAAWFDVVDQVLSDPAYGHKWGQFWLDVVRFAESYGFEHDLDNDNAYHFRDFVIHACNSDQPFDSFIRWHLAGDELKPGNIHARLATGFLAAGPRNADIAQVRVEQERYDELDDIARTIGSGFLGLTIGCARCHDHKFDPIPQREYYEFIKIFDKSIRGEVDIVPIGATHPIEVKALVAGEGLEPLARIYNPGPAFYEDTWLLNRGDVNLKEYTVSPGLLGVLNATDDLNFKTWQHPSTSETAKHNNRSTLAYWLTDVEEGAGPLLARVIANRVWQFHFGSGIVSTPNDFGARGAAPSHPDLLEWLATELVESGWSIKHLHRLILTSRTYRQRNLAEQPTDKQVTLFHGFPVRRLHADAIHDTLLASTQQLSGEMYGPSVNSKSSNRRAIYYRVKRSELHPFLRLFDCPDTLQSSGKRPTSTVPSQALALLNSHSVGQLMADFASETINTHDANISEIVKDTFNRFLSRNPNPREKAAALAFIEKQVAAYGKTATKQISRPQIVENATLVLRASDRESIRLTRTDRVQGWSGSRDLPAFTPLDASMPPGFSNESEPLIRFSPNSTPLILPNERFRPIGTGDFTFTVRFRVPLEAGSDNQILGKDSYKGQPEYSGFYLQQIGRTLRFTTRNTAVDGPQGYLDVADRFEPGRWFVVTGKRHNNTLSLTINADFPNSAVRAEVMPIDINNDVPFKIGDIDEDPSGRLHGDISHLLFYHHALPDLQIRQNHKALNATPIHTLIRTPLEMAVADFCQTIACLNEFIYIR